MDLSLVTSEVLIAELLSRFDHGVVTLRQSRRETHDFSEQLVIHQWIGDEFMCIGLLENVKLAILDSLEIEAADGDDEYDDETREDWRNN
jgi:hypothetical protein